MAIIWIDEWIGKINEIFCNSKNWLIIKIEYPSIILVATEIQAFMKNEKNKIYS